MSTIQEILKTKGEHIHAVQPDATVLKATHLMNEQKVGAVVVIENERMVGVFTERDVLRRVVAAEKIPAETLVRDVMTTAVVCCKPETEIEEARGVMKNRRIRHLPVMDDDGKLLGLISIGDLNAYKTDDQESTIYMLQEYLHGRV